MPPTSLHERPGIFTPAEIDFLNSQRLARIATVGANGQPHVTPVAFRYNPETATFDIGGHGHFASRKKWRDAQQNPQVAIVIDAMAAGDSWKAQGIEIRGVAALLSTGGESIGPGFGPEMFRITPKRIVSWGLDTAADYALNARSIDT
jgi:pyridoxamine 5'-phosphate oxidase family protein